MAEKQVDVDVIQNFPDDDYGWVDPGRKTVRADVAKRWIDEGKALPVMGGASRAVVETPEDSVRDHETADLRRKK